MTAPQTNGDVTHDDMANAIRALAMDAVEAAQSGHPGMPMGTADIATVLFTRFMRFDPLNPHWPDRDRFILSAGHGSMLLYALGYLLGYEQMTIGQLRHFRQLGSLTAGHPEVDVAAGIETTTGPLGQGLGNAVGFALAERLLNARYGDDLINHYTYVLASDGDLMEGISHEAAALAGHLKLKRLIVLWDDNKISIDGPTGLSFSEEVLDRFEAYSWQVQNIDGHDPEQIADAIGRARHAEQPSIIACRTTIGYGAPKKAGTAGVHGAPLGAEEVKAARQQLDWPHEPFEIPEPILQAWRETGRRGQTERETWAQRHGVSAKAVALDQAMRGEIPQEARAAIRQVRDQAAADRPKIATRKASGNVLDALMPAFPSLIGGSADLSGSNNTKAKNSILVEPGNYGGQYIHYGVREHGMAAAMNGMALHGGVVPYGGTFLVFSDYCRPAIRLAALMQRRVIFIMTHDSIGLGEDGPTHQPVEHLVALRAIPNVTVFRPADAVETAECWELALARHDGPSVLALSRQGVPGLRDDTPDDLPSAQGAYVLREAAGPLRATLIATGTEVAIAVEAAELLAGKGIGARVVSMPCRELFLALPEEDRAEILGEDTLKVGVEAAVEFGWERLLGPDGIFVGMHSFGASGPAEALYRHFGITPDAVAERVSERLALV